MHHLSKDHLHFSRAKARFITLAGVTQLTVCDSFLQTSADTWLNTVLLKKLAEFISLHQICPAGFTDAFVHGAQSDRVLL